MSEFSDDGWAIFLGKVNRCARDVIDGYAELAEMVTPRKGTGEGPAAPDPFPKAPANLDAIDLAAEIEREVKRLHRMVCGVLQIHKTGPRTSPIADAVRFLAHSVPALWTGHRRIGEDVVDTMWMLAGKTNRRTHPSRTYLTARPCGACGAPAVMVDPDHARSRCAACGHTQTAETLRPTQISGNYSWASAQSEQTEISGNYSSN